MAKHELKVNDFIDEMNEGVITINDSGIINTYNTKAKEMLGARRNCFNSHESGKLEKGDIVILAYTSFGADKGGINSKDLKSLGIDFLDIEKGTTLLAVGQYLTQKAGRSKIKHADNLVDQFIMDDTFLGVSFQSKIDYSERYVDISVNRENYRYYFNNYFNHIVILDSKTHKVKFYQMGGYTLWKEDLKDFIKGGSFREKVKGYNELGVLNAHIKTFHEEEEIIHDLILCSKGEKGSYTRKSGTINGISIISTLIPMIRNRKIIGATLLISDMTRLQLAENQRNMAYKKLERATAALDDKKKYDSYFSTIVGSSQRIMETKRLAYKASCFKSTVLILGESGTGKSILAKAIHDASDLKTKPFIEVNCNSIPETLIESEMFGYEKGAFTGASNKGKKGYFELAHGGTIFLDEIGELSKSIQVKLLNAIQNKSFYRVGGEEEVKVDVRIIAATNRNLGQDVKNGLFREDLYYRINVFPIKQSSLRERSEDIHELVNVLLPKIAQKVGVTNKSVSAEAFEKMSMYDWPGNIRELENVLERAVNLCEDRVLLADHINIQITQKNYINEAVLNKSLKELTLEMELDVIEQVLAYTGGDKMKAMEVLKIKKTKLYERIKEIEKRKSS